MLVYCIYLLCVSASVRSGNLWRSQWEPQLPCIEKQLVHTLHAAYSHSERVFSLTGSFVVICSPSLCFSVHLKVIILCPVFFCTHMHLCCIPPLSLCLCLSLVYLISQSSIHLFLFAIIPSICFYPTILWRLDKNSIESDRKFNYFWFNLYVFFSTFCLFIDMCEAGECGVRVLSPARCKDWTRNK